MVKNKIIPHLWFDTEAQEAAGFYTSIFPDSRITSKTTLRDTPSGDTDVVTFDLVGHRFMAISAGPLSRSGKAKAGLRGVGAGRVIDGRQYQERTVWLPG